MDDIDEGVLLKTIRIPKNILFLTERLPEPNYDKGRGNIKNAIINNNRDKKFTFPNKFLPNIKLKFNNNQKNNEKNNNINLNILNKNKGNNRINISEKNAEETKLSLKENIDNVHENNEDNNNNLNGEANNHNNKKNNLKNNTDLSIKNNIEIRRNKTNSKHRVMTIEEEIKELNYMLLKDEMIKKDEDKSKIFKKEKTDIYYNLLPFQKNNNMCDLSEKKEYDLSYLNPKKYQKKIKRIIPKDDEFQKYLKSIGLGDIYKLCMPNSFEKNSYKNRYKLKNKYGHFLPQIYRINNNKKENENFYEEKKIIPNRRLIPIGKKLI